MRLPPQMKAAYHHLRRIDQVVMQSRTLTRPESACPMRFLQLTSKTRLVAGDASECEEAILKVTRQKGTVLQVLDRLSLGVQQPLYSLDDFIAMGQEQLEKFDMRVKRHLDRTLCGWPSLPLQKTDESIRPWEGATPTLRCASPPEGFA